MPEPTVLLLSTSDTDLISARSSGKNYRWANPSRLSDLELTDLLAEASIVVIRILGGYRAWQSGIDTVIAGGVPAVLVSGEQAADAELTDRSTVAAGTALQAHIYLAHGGVDNLRELHAFLCDTVLMTGFGFTPPVATPTWGVLEDPQRHRGAQRYPAVILGYPADGRFGDGPNGWAQLDTGLQLADIG